jgi:hypothetical protein
VGLRAGLDDMEKRTIFTLPGLELRRLGRAVRRQSLHRLHYPGTNCSIGTSKIKFYSRKFVSFDHLVSTGGFSDDTLDLLAFAYCSFLAPRLSLVYLITADT